MHSHVLLSLRERVGVEHLFYVSFNHGLINKIEAGKDAGRCLNFDTLMKFQNATV